MQEFWLALRWFFIGSSWFPHWQLMLGGAILFMLSYVAMLGTVLLLGGIKITITHEVREK